MHQKKYHVLDFYCSQFTPQITYLTIIFVTFVDINRSLIVLAFPQTYDRSAVVMLTLTFLDKMDQIIHLMNEFLGQNF